jgi:hypothetical protein
MRAQGGQRNTLAMKMKIIIAIACLGLLMWVEPANAQQRPQPQIPFELTVGVHDHERRQVTDARIDKILKEASKVLNKCNVVLTRTGSVGTFIAPNTEPNQEALIETKDHRDAVHRESFDIKVVKIPFFFCLGPPPDEKEIAVGCAFDPLQNADLPQRRSMIVGNARRSLKLTGKIWAHEFGHHRGLSHRNEAKALMNCKVKAQNDRINDHECKCIREGPLVCNETPTRCPSDDNIR